MPMTYRRLDVIEITELVRLLRSGESDRTIARVLGHNRRTVIRYRTWATEQGILEGAMPDSRTLDRLLAETLTPPPPPQQTSSVAGYTDMRETIHSHLLIRSACVPWARGPARCDVRHRPMVRSLPPSLRMHG
jgi:hypothetical protein